MRVVITFYVTLAIALIGFGFAGPTAGAPAAVVTGSLGLLGTIAATVARIETEDGTKTRPRRGAGGGR